ncbi:hypothetical protein LG195_20975, partial [Proteus terrae]|uniref:hypothetical protein n=1 Tax=Proteus terrae TaxID=1574161 RepID=UPI00207D1938
PPLDSFYAQVWCYTKLESIEIDDYFLLEYSIENSNKHPLNRIFCLTDDEQFINNKFDDLFTNYINLIEIYNERDKYMSKGNTFSWM